jgi:ribosome-binding factor A
MTSRKKARGHGSVREERESDRLYEEEEAIFAGPSRAGSNTKTIQLCRQVEEAIAYALAGSASPILRDLYVVGVEPLRGVALLRVLVSIEGEADEHEQTKAALNRARGYFRGEVARAIHRKRVPTLQFVIVAAAAEGWPQEVGDD